MSLDTDPGSELLSSYESDFRLTLAEITQNIDQLQDLSADERKNTTRIIERGIDEAKEIADQIALEIQNLSSKDRPKVNARLRGYRADIEKAKSDLATILRNSDRNDLFRTSALGSKASASIDQRQQLLDGSQRLENSTQKIRDSQRLANESEAIGANILNDLRAQREQIVNSRNTLFEADSYVDRSVRTLKGMARRLLTNRLVNYAIIGILILLILLVIASKFW